MSSKRLLALLSVLLVLSAVTGALAQIEPPAEETEEELTSAIKKISIGFSGGYYSGLTYLELPVIDNRAQIAEGANAVTLFNGEVLDLGIERPANGFDAPIKEVVSDLSYSMCIGFYLSDVFHVNLNTSYTRSRAVLSMMRFEDELPAGRVFGNDLDTWYEEFYDNSDVLVGGNEDTGFKSYMGGFSLAYDASTLKIFGLTPYFGTGFGGVINRFTVLEDKTALYFQLFSGFDLAMSSNLHINARITATTFSFQTEEVGYKEQVTPLTGQFGLTWLFDVKPIH